MKIDERNARDAFQRYFIEWNDANPEKAAAIARHACSAGMDQDAITVTIDGAAGFISR